MDLNHAVLKSANCPPSSQNVMGYSERLAPTKRRRMAVLKNWTRKVTVVVVESCSVSVPYPIHLTTMIQMVRKTKLIPVSA